MWYAMQVQSGSEKKVMQLCRATFSASILQECFYPCFEQVHKKGGQRHIITAPLFPGYLFLVTDQIRELSQELWKIPAITKLLKVGHEIIPIQKEEEIFLKTHGGENHIFTLSKGYMMGDYVQIEEGAFAGYYGKLVYVDRHNRYGVMQVQMFSKTVEMQFGLEIIHKSL